MAIRARDRIAGPSAARPRGNAGFTMMEVIVALAVLATATSIFVSLFRTSMDLSTTSRYQLVAAQVAEARLNAIVSEPAAYHWYYPEAPDKQLFPIKLDPTEPPAGETVSPPAIEPRVPRAAERNKRLYEQMKWRAYGRYPRDDAENPEANPKYIEVVVEVRWEDAGKDALIAMTGAVPASAMPPAETLEIPPEIIGAVTTEPAADAPAVEGRQNE